GRPGARLHGGAGDQRPSRGARRAGAAGGGGGGRQPQGGGGPRAPPPVGGGSGGSRKGEVDLGLILSRRLRIIGSMLRARPRDEKARLTADFAAFALPRLRAGRLGPGVDRVLALGRR